MKTEKGSKTKVGSLDGLLGLGRCVGLVPTDSCLEGPFVTTVIAVGYAWKYL